MWSYAIGLICVYAPLSWVRNLKYFSFGYIIGMVMIIFTTVLVMVYCLNQLLFNGGPANDGFVPVNTSKMWDMIGFSFYSFEGIGTLMPVMKETSVPKKFKGILIRALLTLSVFFSLFGCISYGYFGNQDEKFVINNMDSSNVVIKVTKLLYCVNLVFSYPLTIFPANMTFESYCFKETPDN